MHRIGLSLFLFLLVLAPAQAQISAEDWTRGFYDYYNKAMMEHEHLAGLIPANKGYIAPVLYQELVEAVKPTPDGRFLLDFDPFTNSRGPISSFQLKSSRTEGDEAWVVVTTHFQGPRGPSKSRQKLFLNRVDDAWYIENVIYLDWVGGPESLRTIMKRLKKLR